MRQTHRTLSTILLSSAFAASLATPLQSAPLGESGSRSIVEGNTAFGVALYHELGASEGNLFFSPYSISSALGMTYAGARENTAKEMADVLHFPLDQTQLHPAFQRLNEELASHARNSGQKLSIANGLCLTLPGVKLKEEFTTLLKDNYDAQIFSGQLDEVNGWVKKKTEGKIETILKELDPNSVCVLLNAIYFKGTWESSFEKKNTHDAPFQVSAKNQVTVPFMHQAIDLKFLDEKEFQAVSIPYKGGQLSMMVLLPKDAAGLAALEARMTTEKLHEWVTGLEKQPPHKILLDLPKYKLETDYDLVPYCQKLGMKDAFDERRGNFRGILEKDLHISQIVHKAFVEVNEEGTEAAAATAVEITPLSIRIEDSVVFRADHPFLFLIRDDQTGSILFMGRMVDPKSK